MAQDPNPNVTIPGSGVLLHVLNTSGEPVPVQGDDDGAIETVGGGGGGGGAVTQSTGDPATPWYMQGVNAGVPERLATAAKQPALGTAGTPSADVISMQGVVGGTPIPSSNTANSQVDGHSATMGATGDADTATTLVGLLKWIKARLPTALGAGGGVKVDGSGTALPTSNAVSSQADGHSATLGTTGDASTATTVIGRLQKLVSLLPTALGAGGGLKIDGSGTSLPVETELPTAAALSDSMGLAPTVPAVGAYGIAIDGSVARRVRCSTSGNLFVEGPGAAGAALTGRPVAVAFANGGNAVIPAVDTSGRVSITNNRIARAVHLSSATLPAAGAFTSQTPYTIPEGVVSITTYVVYTRGAAGGQVKLRPQWANGTETAYETAVSGSAASGGTLRNQIELREILGPIVDTASAVTFLVQFEVPAGCTTFALYAAEFGVTGTPGTCAITLTARYGS